MSPETRAFLDGVRHAEDPTPEDERRVLSSVHAALATGAAGVGAGTTASSSSAAAANGKLPVVLGTGLKLAGATAGVAALAWAVGLGPFSSDTPEAPASAVRRAKPVPSALHDAPQSSISAAPPGPPAPPAPASVISSEPQKRVARSLVPQVASLREEIALLSEVARALDRGDGASALARLDAHVTDDRQLLAERQAARIRALCLLGRVGEARAAAVDFRRAHPMSVQRDGIDRSCAGGGE